MLIIINRVPKVYLSKNIVTLYLGSYKKIFWFLIGTWSVVVGYRYWQCCVGETISGLSVR